MSYWELQARIARLAKLRPQWAKKTGRHGSWVISEDGLEALVRLRALEEGGMSVSAAFDELFGAMDSSDGLRGVEGESGTSEVDARDEIISILKERLERQDRMIDALLAKKRIDTDT